MSGCCEGKSADTILAAVDSIKENSGLLNRFVNGEVGDMVPLGKPGEPETPCLRDMADQIDKRESAAAQTVIDAGVAEVTDLKNQAAQSAADAAASAEAAAEAAAGNVPMASPVAAGLAPAGGQAGQVYRVNSAGDAYGFETLPPATSTTPGLLPSGGSAGQVATRQEDGSTGWADTPAGVPLLSVTWELCDGTLPGKLKLSDDNGLLSRAAFPEAWAEIQATRASLLVDDTAWLAEVAAQGATLKFSRGDGTSTFRVPLLRGIFPRAADPSKGLAAGTWQPDQVRRITGQAARGQGTGLLYNGDAVTAPFALGSTYPNFPNPTSGTGYALKIDTALLGENYNGAETRPVSGVFTPYMQMYGDVTEAGTANIAALVQATAGKLDTATYEAQRPKTWASAEIAVANGVEVVLTHGLNLADPKNATVEICMLCKTAEHGYQSGDLVRNTNVYTSTSATGGEAPISWRLTSSTVRFKPGIASYAPSLINATTGNNIPCTPANWRWIVLIHYNQ